MYDQHLSNALDMLATARALTEEADPAATAVLPIASTEALVSIALSLRDIHNRLPGKPTGPNRLPGFLGGVADAETADVDAPEVDA